MKEWNDFNLKKMNLIHNKFIIKWFIKKSKRNVSK